MWASLTLSAKLNALFLTIFSIAAAANIALMMANVGPRIAAEANQSAELSTMMIRAALSAGARTHELVEGLTSDDRVHVLINPAPREVFSRAAIPLEHVDAAVPKWFFDFVHPSARLNRLVDEEGRDVVILADPRNEIREAWQDLRNFALLSLAFIATVGFFSFRVISENRHLMGRLISLQDDERRIIAQELHDEIGPLLFAIRANASALLRDPKVAAILDAVERVQNLNRRLLRRLWPADLETLGLSDALAALIAGWRESTPQLDISLKMPERLDGVAPAIALAIYRLVQEGLTNIMRHANADHAVVSIDYQQADQLRVAVADDGRGQAAGSRLGMGLLGLSERLRVLGGTLKIGNRPAGGFEIEARLPVD